MVAEPRDFLPGALTDCAVASMIFATVYGFDAIVSGFFWFAGQGGFGIQTAPAAADLALRLLRGEPAGPVDPAPYSPARFG